MMPVRFLDARSVVKMRGVKTPLVQLVYNAFEISPVPFLVTEGLRSLERQRYLFATGKTHTLQSAHLTGDAVDVAALVDGKVSWLWAPYEEISIAFKDAAKRLGVEITWGGDWPKFRDGCHFQLDRVSGAQ